MNNKLSNIQITHNVRASILVSHAKKKKFLHLDEKIIIQSDHINPGKVGGVFDDKQKLELFFKSDTTLYRDPSLESPGFDKNTILELLKGFINKPDTRGFLMVISGSGVLDYHDSQVKLILSEENEEQLFWLSFQDLIDLWDERINKETNKSFLMILDFCHSGNWIEQLIEMNRSDISIQASCKSSEASIDIFGIGGLFIHNFLFANNASDILPIKPPQERTSANELNCLLDQTPQFYGNDEIARSLFGIKVGYNSWTELLKAQNKKINNGYYIGQTKHSWDATFNQFKPINHGTGSAWTEDNHLAAFGEFENQHLVKRMRGDILHGSDSLPGTKNVKLDPTGNLLYGNFKGGRLEGQGILITSQGIKWTGNFTRGDLSGEVKYTNLLGWTIQGITDGLKFHNIKKITDPNGSEIDFEMNGKKTDGKKWIIDEKCNLVFGTVENKKLNGEGIIINSFGHTIQVEFKHDLIYKVFESNHFGNKCDLTLVTTNSQGNGTWIYQAGSLYHGILVNGAKSGSGTEMNRFGELYIGGFINNKREEKGKLYFPNGNAFEGDFQNGLYNGRGKFTFVRGDFYEGDFKDNKREGNGLYVFANGDCYDGSFVNGLYEGQGILRFLCGDSYEGGFKNDKKEGKGKLTFANGNTYEGDFVNGAYEGKGKYTFANGNIFEGDFVNGLYHGWGKFTFASGDVYEGEYKHDKRHGLGKYNFENGNLYEGEFANGLYHGNGKYTYDSGDIYEGEFKHGLFHGKGICYYINGNIYEGEFQNDKREGRGKYTFANGNFYMGEFKQGIYDGHGKFIYASGNVYEGEFKQGLYEGRGELVFKNGNKYEGEFKNDKLEGKGRLTLADGNIMEGYWNNGELTESGVIHTNVKPSNNSERVDRETWEHIKTNEQMVGFNDETKNICKVSLQNIGKTMIHMEDTTRNYGKLGANSENSFHSIGKTTYGAEESNRNLINSNENHEGSVLNTDNFIRNIESSCENIEKQSIGLENPVVYSAKMIGSVDDFPGNIGRISNRLKNNEKSDEKMTISGEKNVQNPEKDIEKIGEHTKNTQTSNAK